MDVSKSLSYPLSYLTHDVYTANQVRKSGPDDFVTPINVNAVFTVRYLTLVRIVLTIIF